MCRDGKGEFVYFNKETEEMSLENPMDLLYMQKVKEGRKGDSGIEGHCSQLDDYFVDLLMQKDQEQKDTLTSQGITTKRRY